MSQLNHVVSPIISNCIVLLQFLMIYRKARAGELTEESLKRLAVLTEINVEEVGVYGAKEFFEAKV